MEERDSGIADKVSDAVDRVKQAVTGDESESDQDQPQTEVEGRAGVIRRALRAYGEGDIDGFLDALSDDVEWVAPEGRKFPGAGSHRGRDAVRNEFIEEVKRGFPEFGYRPTHYLDAEEERWVVTLGSFVGQGASGEFDVPAAVVWEFEQETVSRVRIHADSDALPERVKEDDQEQEREPEAQEGEGRAQDRDERSDDSSQSEEEPDDQKA